MDLSAFFGVFVWLFVVVVCSILLFVFRTKKILTFICGMILFLAGFLAVVITSGGVIKDFIDIPLILGILLQCVPVMFISGYYADFANAFRIVFKNKKSTLNELKKSRDSISFLEKILFVSAAFIAFTGFFSIFSHLDDWASFFPNAAIAILPFSYAFILFFFLKSLKGSIEQKIIDFDENS